jgi:uncharacterized protein (TIGR03435 family)
MLNRSKQRSNNGRLAVVWLAVALMMFVSGVTARAQSQSKPADAPATLPKFEVASIRIIPLSEMKPMAESPLSPPGALQFTARNVSIGSLIGIAFGVSSMNQVSGLPSWNNSTFYQIQAKPEGDVGLSYDQLKPYLQQLLQERFHLTYHRETKSTKGYALVVAKGGPKLTATKGGTPYGFVMGSRIQLPNTPASGLAGILASPLGEPVVDETGLKGNYDIVLNFAPMNSTDSDLPSIFTAIEEQLGLKLERRDVQLETIVIDHVDREPTEN